MLRPIELKFRKGRKGRIKGRFHQPFELSPGTLALKALESGRITARQIEATRRAITRQMKRRGNVRICIFPFQPITNKPIEVRMGKGKGNVAYWVCSVPKGKILYEIRGVPLSIGLQALRAGSHKLPLLTKIVYE